MRDVPSAVLRVAELRTILDDVDENEPILVMRAETIPEPREPWWEVVERCVIVNLEDEELRQNLVQAVRATTHDVSPWAVVDAVYDVLRSWRGDDG